MRLRTARFCLPSLASLVPCVLVAGAFGDDRPEPTAELAALWWPPMENVWTPIGWKDHLFRFNVLYNGTVLAQPHVFGSKKASSAYADQAVQLTFEPSADGRLPPPRTQPYQLRSTADFGIGNQGWTANPTPVLWTEWPRVEGLVLRQEAFAHITGAADVRTGVEPLYAWIRLSVRYADGIKSPKSFGFLVRLGAVNVHRTMSRESNLTVDPAGAIYPRTLTAASDQIAGSESVRLVEPDGRVRLVVMPAAPGAVRFIEREKDGRDYYLHVSLSAVPPTFVDLLLPMIPGRPEDVAAEAALGFDEALTQADAYWARTPATAARIDTPEPQINLAVKHTLRLAELIAERNPDTGEYSLLSGSGTYDALWPTPTSMVTSMLLDPLGYHSVAEKYLELFRANQGTVKPPGPAYKLYPGYFSSPKTLTSIDWLSDHGAILHQVCRHALLSGDERFTRRWLDAIVRGCDFIRDARATIGHGGVPGILPPAVATDERRPIQGVWNDGWNYQGLVTAARLLRRIQHPRAEEFAAEARQYKDAFGKALRELTQQMPEWIDTRGHKHRIVPDAMSTDIDSSRPFYLDTGPLFPVWAGLLPADDPLMRSTLAFFREGPHTKLFDPRGNAFQRPVLVHEMSSCEPCYSWNVYHSWQSGDRYRFLEGMYSLLAGALSTQTFVSCETRHGIHGNIFASPILVDLVRLSVIDDAIAEDELHLLRLVPRAWLRTDHITAFDRIVTEYGPVTLRFRLADEGKTLEVALDPAFRREPKHVRLHVPPLASLAKVIINGKPVTARPGDVLLLAEQLAP